MSIREILTGKKQNASAVCKVVNSMGVHARPACLLVQKASEFEASVTLCSGARPDPVDGKSLMSVLTLAAGSGTEIRITAEGRDAEEAVVALVELFESGFGED